MEYERFFNLVGEALDSLPEPVRGWLDNVQVVVADWPSADQLADVGIGPGSTLLGLYEGVPRTARTSDYGMVLPDKVTLFRGPMLAMCATDAAVKRQVQRTVAHEIAHHFGIDDDRLRDIGAY